MTTKKATPAATKAAAHYRNRVQTKRKSAKARKPAVRSTPPPATAAVPAGAAGAPERKLTPLQQQIANDIGDLLVNGGDNKTAELLIRCAQEHSFKRRAREVWGESEKEAQDFVAKCRLDTNLDLAELKLEWHRNRTATAPEKLNPKSASDRIRAAFLETLREQQITFANNASPEEVSVMIEILQIHESSNRGPYYFEEMPLGMAIENTMGEYHGNWLRVPNKLEDQVKAYINRLRAADRCRTSA
jgi:hypothetical protein